MEGWAALIVGLLAVFGTIVLQMIMPFAFDFVSTLVVYGAGVFIGRQMKK